MGYIENLARQITQRRILEAGSYPNTPLSEREMKEHPGDVPEEPRDVQVPQSLAGASLSPGMRGALFMMKAPIFLPLDT